MRELTWYRLPSTCASSVSSRKGGAPVEEDRTRNHQHQNDADDDEAGDWSAVAAGAARLPAPDGRCWRWLNCGTGWGTALSFSIAVSATVTFLRDNLSGWSQRRQAPAPEKAWRRCAGKDALMYWSFALLGHRVTAPATRGRLSDDAGVEALAAPRSTPRSPGRGSTSPHPPASPRTECPASSREYVRIHLLNLVRQLVCRAC